MLPRVDPFIIEGTFHLSDFLSKNENRQRAVIEQTTPRQESSCQRPVGSEKRADTGDTSHKPYWKRRGDINRFKSLGELTAELYRSIHYYNYERIHTSLGMPPKKFAEKFAQEKENEYNTKQEKLTV